MKYAEDILVSERVLVCVGFFSSSFAFDVLIIGAAMRVIDKYMYLYRCILCYNAFHLRFIYIYGQTQHLILSLSLSLFH